MTSVEKLVAARQSLKTSLDKTKALSFALEKAGPRLKEINQRLPYLESTVRPIRAHKEALFAAGGHINRAVGPAAAVLKVFDAVHGLEKSLLSDPRNDLWSYLSVLKQLEEALRFLEDNCGLAIQWLEDIVEYLEDNSVADPRYLLNLKKSLKSLRELQSDRKQDRLDGGLLDAALDKLESEFRRLLMEHSSVVSLSSSSPGKDQHCISPSPLPVSVIQKLQFILGRLTAHGRLNKCLSIYVDVRSSNINASLLALKIDYLQITEVDDVQSIEGHIAQWGKHLEFAVKHLFETEYKLCNDVLERMGHDIWMPCFSKIALQAGILDLLRFGKTATQCKKDPIKLLKLLDVFNSLNKLRLDFNRLFGSKPCIEIQNFTRDLIKAVIEGACEIFWELLVQVELQRQTPPPANGTVPKVVSFITEYCNILHGDDYSPVLTQVLVIHRSWKQEHFQERLLTEALLNIIRAVEVNIETWSRAYEDTTLSHLFLMNNHWHLFKHLKGTKLGDLLGDGWLREHEQYKEYYSALFLADSWQKLPALLSREGLIFFSGGRATARDLVKKRLKAFNEAFDDVYKKQSCWIVPDKDLREKTCQIAIQTIVPVYRSYMQNYGPLVEKDESASKYAKYTPQTLENMLSSLFQPKLGRYPSVKAVISNGKFNNLVASQHQAATTVV